MHDAIDCNKIQSCEDLILVHCVQAYLYTDYLENELSSV